MGDGFYEQRLVNEQVGQLTGRRFTGDYASDDAQYKGLMDSGVRFAQRYPLRLGIALSAEQMAQLTGDIVWLGEQSVTLPDGTATWALVPQLYVANIKPGDLDGSGALLSAKNVTVNVTGDLNNSGSIGSDIKGNSAVNHSANNAANAIKAALSTAKQARWHRGEKNFLRAMAQLGFCAIRLGDIVFMVPLFDEFIKRGMLNFVAKG